MPNVNIRHGLSISQPLCALFYVGHVRLELLVNGRTQLAVEVSLRSREVAIEDRRQHKNLHALALLFARKLAHTSEEVKLRVNQTASVVDLSSHM
eukprot:COSAG02_NODE_5577_length_4217_cov_2.366926_4_plen_94_part_01